MLHPPNRAAVLSVIVAVILTSSNISALNDSEKLYGDAAPFRPDGPLLEFLRWTYVPEQG